MPISDQPESLSEEEYPALTKVWDNDGDDIYDQPQDAVPDEAKLTPIEIVNAGPKTMDQLTAASEKAWHARDLEVAQANSFYEASAEEARVAVARMNQIQEELEVLQPLFDTQTNALALLVEERDAMLEQVRALVEAWEYKNDWEARSNQTAECSKCTWDSGPYTIECKEHNPDAPMEAAVAAAKETPDAE